MGIKIKFEQYGDEIKYIPQKPTFVLMTRSGKKLGILPATEEDVKCSFNSANEVSFTIHKNDVSDSFWNEITNYKLLWCKEWNKLFELYVEIDEGEGLTKYLTGTSLGEAETGQIMLHGIEINTEDDIANDDYVVTTLYNAENPKASCLDRIMEKAPHYSIAYVDSSLKDIQRTYTFDGVSLYDAFQEIAEENDCIFLINCYLNSDMEIVREIKVYDLLSFCRDCGERGNFTDECPKCGGTDIRLGYGDDTNIIVSVDNLTNDIKYTTDTGSVKNCMRLEPSDDVIAAAVTACNPNGSQYLWYISDEMKADMSDSLVTRLNAYDTQYEYYRDEYVENISSVATAYNTLITKYSTYTSDYPALGTSLTGYSAINEAYYETVDFYYYLKNALMPTISMSDTTASAQAALLTAANLSPVAVTNLTSASSATAESAVLGMAKVIVDSRYKVTASTTSYTSNVWRGNFTVTNNSDDTDTAISSTISVTVNADYETYVQQKIDKILAKQVAYDTTDIVSLFKLSLSDFRNEIKKYGLSSLTNFRENCQSCIDVLIEQGVADQSSWASAASNPYDNLYTPYRNKLSAIDTEITTRTNELRTITNTMNYLLDTIDTIHTALDFQSFLGDTLWLELSAYRREDSYQNSNYISDGLTNAEIIQKANEYIKVASEELYKSAMLQHSITSTLDNLLVMKEFQSIVDYFEVGNWIKIRVDGELYRLRLLEYEVDFDNLEELSVTFSDVTKLSSGMSDVESVLNQASSMATSYGAVTRQAKQGENSNRRIADFVENGLALTTTKIVNAADNQNLIWDEHGFLAREYDTILGRYSDEQLKIINQGLYVTDDGWATASAGIGKFTIWNPSTQQNESRYGVIADTLVGNLILGQSVGIYNTNSTITLNTNGMSITNGTNSVVINPNATYLLDVTKNNKHLLYLDNSGNLNLTGTITAIGGAIGGLAIDTTSIHTSDVDITSNANNSVGLSSSTFTRTIGDTSRGDLKFAIGSKFGVASDGTLYASNGVFSGTITSSNANITGGVINIRTNSNQTSSIMLSGNNTYGYLDSIYISPHQLNLELLFSENNSYESFLNAELLELSITSIGEGVARLPIVMLSKVRPSGGGIQGSYGALQLFNVVDAYSFESTIYLNGSDGSVSCGNITSCASNSASTQGYSKLRLGNGTSVGTVGNSRGSIEIFGTGMHYTTIQSNASTWSTTIYLPDAGGTIGVINTTTTSNTTNSNGCISTSLYIGNREILLGASTTSSHSYILTPMLNMQFSSQNKYGQWCLQVSDDNGNVSSDISLGTITLYYMVF